MYALRRIVLLVLLFTAGSVCYASHIIGGEITYRYMGEVAGGKSRYLISLSIYEDCLHGSPQAIEEDNPAYFAVYDDVNNLLSFDSARFATSINVPPNYDVACITNPPEMCMLKKTFLINFDVPRNGHSYTVIYQRCCRNGDIVNIVNPSNTGATFTCTIPADTVASSNNSAVYKNFPPQIICVNNPLLYDNSATDADGDSLSYELCESYDAPNGLPNNVIPLPPPFALVAYKHPPYSYYNPLNAYPALAIDPVTGMITGKPLITGRYLVTVCCNEWRHGRLINTIHREFQFVVTDCSKAVLADMPYFTDDPNVYQVNCKDFIIDFANTSKGGNSWFWDFGVSGTGADASTDFQPTFVYPDTGVYTVKLVANPHTPCADSIEKRVKVFPVFTTAFTDTGVMCPSSPVGFIDQSVGTTSPVNGWLWTFGDGTSATEANPVHLYSYGGTYNVTLISRNQKDCVDTLIHQVTIETFKPFAGPDTTIVKGEQVQLYASGGTSYQWLPAVYLKGTDGNTPMGYFSDTGLFTYVVFVKSYAGCMGSDTVSVHVVGQPAFFMPSGFTPNGDGRNDLFRPICIGYKAIRFFRIFNRYGEQVFLSDNIEEGWDGTYNHKTADMGTYYWYVGYVDRYGHEGTMQGDITLIR